MEIKKLWEKYKFPNCDNCEKDCKGRLDYNNLCANLNYLKEYAEYNYKKNKESFEELKNLTKNDSLYIFSFGCGLGLDYIGAKEVLVGDIKYYGIDECDWAIKRTESYKNFQPKLPKTIKYDEGIFLLTAVNENAVICFFNSLFTISNNSDLEDQLVEALRNKKNFYIICNYTINSNFHLPKEEKDFLNNLKNRVRGNFKIKCFEILDGKGIILQGSKNF